MTGVLCTVYGAQVYFIKVVVNKSKAYYFLKISVINVLSMNFQ